MIPRNKNIDALIKSNKNKERISFSWGFEYRYLIDLSDELLNIVALKNKCKKDDLILLKSPSEQYTKNLNEHYLIKNKFRLTPEILCIEGIKKKYLPYDKGSLGYLLPGQNYLESIHHINNDIYLSPLLVEETYNQRLRYDFLLKDKISKKYNITKDQIAFNWGSVGSLEMILYAIKAKSNKKTNLLMNVPNYYVTMAMANKIGYKMKLILSYSGGSYRFPFKAMLKELKSEKYELMVLTSPNNPFGIPIEKNQFRELLMNVPRKTFVMIDFTGLYDNTMYYFDDILKDNKFQDINIFMLDSISKKYEMAHARVGMILCPNEQAMKELKINLYSPVLTIYAYQKLDEAFSNPHINKSVISKHKRYYSILNSMSNSDFRIISPHFSNFIISRFKSSVQIQRLIQYLSNRYNYYDLPFYGIGKFSSGKGSINQDFIQYLPKNNLRILEETAEFIADGIRKLK